MRLCNDIMTLFNARPDPGTGGPAYAATVIRGVRWWEKRGVLAEGRGGFTARHEAVVRLPVDADAGGRHYVSPGAYRRAADVSGLFTLAPGDLLARGEFASPEAAGDACRVLTGITDDTDAPRGAHWKLIAE